MRVPIPVVTLLRKGGLLVEQTLGEGVVLTLDSLRLALTGDHVQ